MNKELPIRRRTPATSGKPVNLSSYEDVLRMKSGNEKEIHDRLIKEHNELLKGRKK